MEMIVCQQSPTSGAVLTNAPLEAISAAELLCVDH